MTTGYEIRAGSQILAERIKQDPPAREDGLCVVCEEPLPRMRKQKGVDPMQYVGDPFCSGRCCREWHGIPTQTIHGGDPREKRGRYERAA